ncbi:MAG: hypothetical protein KA746_03430 [Pyrinomonadaceae bacterium]|nr:hypothetical protein [Pyrinomonadaceae bacterium]MBP6214407.1 hypothetical protein [Pyrinomonadaceae bacterium]
MRAIKQREVVIEFERIQLIRKRAKTRLAKCGVCGTDRDFVCVAVAAELFGIVETDLYSFIRTKHVHLIRDTEICLTSLMAAIGERQNGERTRLIGNGSGSPDRSISGSEEKQSGENKYEEL